MSQIIEKEVLKCMYLNFIYIIMYISTLNVSSIDLIK